MIEEIKECPFCSGKALEFPTYKNDGWMIGCSNNDCEVDVYCVAQTLEEAIVIWNKRA